ncbi:hypothetical protein ACFL6C_03395 [Myxococcota bacterium]
MSLLDDTLRDLVREVLADLLEEERPRLAKAIAAELGAVRQVCGDYQLAVGGGQIQAVVTEGRANAQWKERGQMAQESV